MATSHDNFFITTLIDRITGNSIRVDDLTSLQPQTRIEFTGSNDTDTLGASELYAYTGVDQDITLTLNTEMLEKGSPENPYYVTVKDEAGVLGGHSLIIVGDSTTVDGISSVHIQGNHCSIVVYSNGTAWFVLYDNVVYRP